ncbi:MAG: hypothetical protein IAX21_02880 [Candidatus Bathyarchaeota archaeon]|nr:hypothetical protein [Candidatus Bathyarchaeum tardum]WGM90039.1 MAG: hypothetical protein NUK63_02665 [Candidatus Bathyarchaeum tardum]WNZ29819.1 MAG: hypothetical protein IAX21_02880 [Candidatus Bathyarchaeota archaeon]
MNQKRNKKYLWIAVFAAVLVCCSSIAWVLAGSNQNENIVPNETNDSLNSEISSPEQIRDEIIQYIQDNHPDVTVLINNFEWTGGLVETGLLGAGLYNYQSEGWTVEISYPIVANPTFDVKVEYSVPSGMISIPYSLNWEGTWENGTITETNYFFAQ